MPDSELKQGSDINQRDLDLLTGLAKEAGRIAMQYFGDNPQVWMKEGNSPVSEADFAIDKFLREQLLEARPNYGWLSEETDDNEERLAAKRTFVVDPIDGTRGFINGMKRWCVSVAIVENNRPVAGVLECPVLGETITACKNGGAFRNDERLTVRNPSPDQEISVTGPRSLERSFADISVRNVTQTSFVPSLAYRIAMVALKELDVAIARGSAKDWDLAAADLILHEAGGSLIGLDERQCIYNCSDVRHGSLLGCARQTRDEMLDLVRQAMNKTTN